MRRVHLALSLRVTIAAILALVAAQFFGLPLPLWVVLTAVIVTQMSVGRSLKATGDYLLGTVGGSIYGGAVAILIPHESELALLAVLVIALAPLALLAAVRPSMNVVPITAIIVLLLPGMTHTSALDSAIYRVLEVGWAPLSACWCRSSCCHRARIARCARRAARILDLMARALVA